MAAILICVACVRLPDILTQQKFHTLSHMGVCIQQTGWASRLGRPLS